MDRPRYETVEDRSNQGFVASELCEAWDLLDVFLLPEFSAIDLVLLLPGEKMALAEIKCRNTRSLHYVTLIISRAKIDTAVTIAEALYIPFYLIVQWVDGIFYQQIRSADLVAFSTRMGGRKDRADDQDTEMVYEIPSASFKPIKAIP